MDLIDRVKAIAEQVKRLKDQIQSDLLRRSGDRFLRGCYTEVGRKSLIRSTSPSFIGTLTKRLMK